MKSVIRLLPFLFNLGIWSRNNWWPDGLVQFFISFLKRTLALSAMQLFKSLLLKYWYYDKTIFGGFPFCHYILFWIIWYIYNTFSFIIIFNITGISFSIAFDHNPIIPSHTHTYFWVCKFHLIQCRVQRWLLF